MVRNTNWRGIGVLSALLMGTVVVGCANQNSNPDNIPGARGSAGNNTGAGASATASAGSFDDAANTWSRVEEARAALDTAIKARELDQVREAASKIRDLVKTLPDKSAMLPEDKRKTLDAHVKNVGELAAMMDKFNDPTDMKSAQEHQTAMNDALDMMKGMYPAGAMHSSMHMPNMNSSGKAMSDDSMPGKGMAGMDDKMSGKGMMDKMTSGMSAMDKKEMKRMMNKMMAMPPAERMKAMQKMSGMDKPAEPGMQADPSSKPMPGGAMEDDM